MLLIIFTVLLYSKGEAEGISSSLNLANSAASNAASGNTLHLKASVSYREDILRFLAKQHRLSRQPRDFGVIF